MFPSRLQARRPLFSDEGVEAVAVLQKQVLNIGVAPAGEPLSAAAIHAHPVKGSNDIGDS